MDASWLTAAADPNITPDELAVVIHGIGIYPTLELALRYNPAFDLLVLADPSIETRIARSKADRIDRDIERCAEYALLRFPGMRIDVKWPLEREEDDEDQK